MKTFYFVSPHGAVVTVEGDELVPSSLITLQPTLISRATEVIARVPPEWAVFTEPPKACEVQ